MGKRRKGLERRFKGVLRELELPEDLLPGVPRITLVGRERLLVENVGSVMRYKLTEAVFDTGAGLLTVQGEGLTLLELGESRVMLTGEIEGVRFGGGNF